MNYRSILYFFSFLLGSTCIINSVHAQDFAAMAKMAYQRPDSAYNLLKLKISDAKNNNNTLAEAMALQQMGQVLYHNGNYTQAVNHLLDAEKLLRKEDQPKALAQNLNYLGNVYYYNKQSQKASLQYAEALSIFKAIQDNNGLAVTYGQIGHIFEKNVQYDSAYYYQNLALSLLAKEKDSAAMAKIYENIGSIMEDRMQYDSALYYYSMSLRLNGKYSNSIAQIEVINNLGDVYRKTGNYAQGLIYARKAMAMSLQFQEKYQLSSAYRDIARSFELLKQYDSAYYYVEQARLLLQEIYATENSKQIALMQSLFDTEKKNAEISHLNAQRIKNLAVTIASGIVFLLLLLLAWVMFNRQKLKNKNEQAINEQKQQLLETNNTLLEAKLKNQQLQEENLKQELEIKSKELSSHILHLIQKNKVLETIRIDLNELIKDDKRDQKKQMRQVLQKINISFNQDSYWEEFRLIFDKVHGSFFANLQKICPDLSATEFRLLALIKMNLNSQDIATLMGITPDSLRVTRYRIKKKLQLDPNESLSSFIQSI